MKKIFYCLFTVILLITSCFHVAFADEDTEICSNFVIDSMFESAYLLGDVEVIDSTMLDCDEAFIALYDDETLCYVEMYMLDNGDIKYIVYEGDIVNEIIFTVNGEMYVDGGVVTISIDGESAEPLVSVSENGTARLNRYEVISTCPYGTASDYWNGTTRYYQPSLGNNTFVNTAKLTYINIIKRTLKLIDYIWNTNYSIFNDAFDYYLENCPNQYTFNFSDGRFVHSSLGFSVTDSMSVAKHITKYYSNTACTNTIAGPYTYYEKFTY